MLKVVVFDFDGVILESCDIKTVAFRKLFQDFPEHVEDFVEFHLKNMGVSRYKKFTHFYNNILDKPVDDKKLVELGSKFSDLVLDEIKICNFVPGALEFLENHSNRFKFFIASGTPQLELRTIVRERGLESFFKGIYGSPATKSGIIKKIMKEEHLKKEELVFIGDSETDFKEALKAQVQFIYRISRSTDFTPEKAHCLGIIENLIGLDGLLNR
ncbi:MAG: HAD family hydrolase [Candidatus Hodarchaeales archaeon]|jgi:phosphoglycolate phosphatase-like HAD superfamily hydrolase